MEMDMNCKEHDEQRTAKRVKAALAADAEDLEWAAQVAAAEAEYARAAAWDVQAEMDWADAHASYAADLVEV